MSEQKKSLADYTEEELISEIRKIRERRAVASERRMNVSTGRPPKDKKRDKEEIEEIKPGDDPLYDLFDEP